MAAGDLTDLATVYIAADVGASPSSATQATLAALITAISAYVPNVLNRNVLADNYVETYTGNGKSTMLLRQRPIIQISSIAWNGQTISAQGDPISGALGLWTDGRSACLQGYTFPPNDTPVRIAYAAGYMTVPADISLSVAELVAEAYARRTHVGERSHSQGGQVTMSFDPSVMHAAIKDRLKNYMAVAPC